MFCNLTRAQCLGKVLLLLTITAGIAGVSPAQTTGFTYQGRLTDSGTSANGNYDLQFALWDNVNGGTQIGSTQTINTVAVTNGVFTVSLDFGASSFPGANRFLEVSARPTGGGSFTLLTPRQPITSTPYAVRALNASSADSVPVSAVPGGSGNYIQNTSSAQTGNFNISGNGTVGGTLSGDIVNAAGGFYIGDNRVLSANGATDNIFAGVTVGINNTTGRGNTFLGSESGIFNTTGSNNTLLGNGAYVGAGNLTNATAIGAQALVDQSNALVLGSINGVNGATVSTSVGIGTSAPTNRLDVNLGGSAPVNAGITIQGKTSGLGDLGLLIKNTGTSGNVWFIDSTSSGSNYGAGKLAFTTEGAATPPLAINSTSTVSVAFLGSSGATAVCRNASNELATCSSSLRYKSNVATFAGGLDIINRLRPISFKWKQDGMPDIGLGAEEVAQVEPLLTFRNAKGEIEGVKYNQLSAVFVNAFKEQQEQIREQQAVAERAQEQIAALETANAVMNARLRAIEKALRKSARRR
jgi:hypothetical protein